MKFYILSFAISSNILSFASELTFHDAIKKLRDHPSTDSLIQKARASFESSRQNSSWGDPVFKVSAKNYPRDTLSSSSSAMTGLEFGISQKIALTNKYSKIASSYNSLSQTIKFKSKDRESMLVTSLWEVLIAKRRTLEELEIFNENNRWLSKILNVSKKLYTTGKISQQAILDIRIRKSEIESELSNRRYELLKIKDQLVYLVGSSSIKSDSIPWKLLTKEKAKEIKSATSNKEYKDFKEMQLKELVKAKGYALEAAKLSFIPDVTVSLGYTKRNYQNNEGDQADFVGASLSFPLPLSKKSYAAHKKAIYENLEANKNYAEYKNKKLRDVNVLKNEVEKLRADLSILSSKTIEFAKSSREITSKSYGLGNSSYTDLLQSELKLQKILMQRVMLKAKRDTLKVTLRYLMGDQLYEI